MKKVLHGKLIIITLIVLSVMFLCTPTFAQTKLDDYTFSNLNTTLYGIDKFSTNGTTAVVLNYRQWTETPAYAWIEYAIVEQTFFGDTVYASFDIKESNEYEAHQESFGVVQAGSDRQIRIEKVGMNTVYGYGEIYQR